ncbi:MAG: nuclear transport factor 2 family protein [Alphaproteobacteria bacterium]|nr:nuclear transport factor 2 family protein [Alphaproteobacteria bacterium]
MPTSERLRAFIALVEAGRFVEAIEEFYAPEASMQENLDPPRRGRAVLVAGEKAVLAAVKAARVSPGPDFLVDGDRVAINWVFEFENKDGTRFRLDEIAWQRWRGDRIVEERFYYDPAQRKRLLP